MALSRKHKRFVEEYLKDLNATQAAIRAGYSPASAHVTSNRLYQRPEVAEAIRAAQAERSARTHIDQDWVLDQLKANVERCMSDGPERNAPAANQALQLLGKHLGMFVDKSEVAQVVKWYEDVDMDKI